MRDHLTTHRAEMDRLRRRSRVTFGAGVLILVIIALGAAWVLAHPRLIGSYIGEVADGYQENSK